jgi:hypothetical protein
MKPHSELEEANRRAHELQARFPRAVSACYQPGTGKIVVHLSSRLDVSFSPQDAQGLEDARPSQLQDIEISPSGFGLYFPALDADIYVPGLLEGFPGSKSWMEARPGQTAGQSGTDARKSASRANGRRPKRVAEG